MNDRDKQTVSLWMNVEVAPDAPCLTKDERADVVIVGSGIAGFSLEDIKLILDHSEGAPAGDVTAGHYALDPMIEKKRAIMKKWLAWLELRVDAAIAADPSLLDCEAVGEAIFRARHGNERWKKRVERTRKTGVGILDYPYAGKKKKKVA